MIIAYGFYAPRGLEVRAFTDPPLIPEWRGPRRLSANARIIEVQMRTMKEALA